MYLWKYWRESRITFAVGLLLVGLLLWAVLKIHLGALSSGPRDVSQQNLAQLYLVITAGLTLPLGFLGLRFGSFGIGRDLGEGSGSFLFSRPRTHAFFVWSDWSYGMAQLLTIVVAANAVLALEKHRYAPDSAIILMSHQPISMLAIFCLHCTSGVLLAGLIFGLTYFSSVLARRHGVQVAIGAVLTFDIARLVVEHYWPRIVLPGFTLSEFSFTRSPTMPAGFADHLVLAIALRTALALAFPVAAQLLLQQRDID
jgi:hypothetical protein